MAKRAHQQVPPSATGANDVLARSSGGEIVLIDGATAPVGAANTASIRYLDSTSKLQVSLDGGAYVDIATGTAGMAIGGAVTSGTNKSVLFINASGQLAQDNTKFNYDTAKGQLFVQSNGVNASAIFTASGAVSTVLLQNLAAAGLVDHLYYDNNGTIKASIGYANGSYTDANIAGKVYISKANIDLMIVDGSSIQMRVTSSATGGRVAIGAHVPTYQFDARYVGNTGQFHIVSNSLGDVGMYLTATAASHASVSGGAVFNNTDWMAKATTASALDLLNGEARFFGNTGLTAGVGFTPTLRFTVKPDAALVLADGAASGNYNGGLRFNDTTNKFQVCLDGSTWSDVATGAGAGMSIGGAVTSGTSGSVLFVNSSGNLAQDNVGLFWDDTGKSLRIVGNGATTSERTTTSTNSVLGSFGINLTSSNNMVDGFGPSMFFRIKDDGGTTFGIAYIGAARAGADNSGDLVFATADAGTTTEWIKVATGGGLVLVSSPSAAVGAVNTAKLRYDDTTSKLQVSLDGAAYVDVATGSGGGGMSIGGAVTSGTSGSILFVDGSGNLAQENANLFYDATLNKLTVGQNIDNLVVGDVLLAVNPATNARGVVQIGTYGTSSTGSEIHYLRTRGTAASPTAVLSGDDLGAIVWQGQYSTGASQSIAARIDVIATENFSAVQRGSKISFSVAANFNNLDEVLIVGGTTAASATLKSPFLSNMSSETHGVLFDNSTNNYFFSTAPTTQRHVLFSAPTYDLQNADTFTNVATVGISGAPIAGTNATITHSSCLLLDPGAAGNGISINQSGTGVGQAALRVVLTDAAAKAMLVTETGNGTQPMLDLNRSGTSSASIINATSGGSTTGAIFNLTQAGSGTAIIVTNTGATNPWCFEGICNGVTPLETGRFGLRMRSGASDATDTVKYSPMVVLKGAAWTGSVDENVEFCFQVRPAAAATPTGVLHILYGLGGGVLASRLRLSSVGTLGLNVQSSDPTPSEGDIWYNGTSDVLKYRDGTATQTVAATGVAQSFSKQQSSTPFALTDGANIAVNALNSNVFTVTLGGNRTLDNPTNLAAGQTFMFIITQDGTGGRTLSYGTAYDFGAEGAPTLTTAAGKVDVISGIALSTTKIACTVLKGFL